MTDDDDDDDDEQTAKRVARQGSGSISEDAN